MMKFRLPIYLGVIVFLMFFLGCGASSDNKLARYIKNIPEEESINASQYNYELVVVDVQAAYQKSNYYEVLKLYEHYEEVFFESPVIDESELTYWLGLSLNKIFNDSEISPSSFNTNFFNYLKKNRKRKNLFAIEFEGKYISNKNGETFPTHMYYKGKHFFDIINQRVDYELEKKALHEVYLQKFTTISKAGKGGRGGKGSKKNFEQLYWIVTRYPDLFTKDEYNNLKDQYLNLAELKKSDLEKLIRIDSIISIEAGASTFPHEGESRICFPVSEPIVVYNRTDWVSSRNLATIGMWEPFEVLTSLNGENTNTIWYKIRFKNERDGYIDEESYNNSCGNESLNGSMWRNMKSKYLLAYKKYLEKDYLTVVEQLSEILYELENQTDESPILLTRLWTFFYQNLKEIAVRSTSLNNDFTAFALKHSEYFEVSKNQINLEVDDYFLKKVIELDPESPMLQYFEGFN